MDAAGTSFACVGLSSTLGSQGLSGFCVEVQIRVGMSAGSVSRLNERLASRVAEIRHRPGGSE